MTPILETKRLTIAFGGLIAVRELDLSVERGSIHGIIGPNGSGKTTVFNLITGFYKPTSGDILLEGRSMARKAPHRIIPMGVVRTFQNIRLFKNLTVLENVLIGYHTHIRSQFICELVGGAAKAEQAARERCLEIVRVFGLEDAKDQRAGSLPYGRQRELEIARAMAARPKLLLLDEPAAGMSAGETQRLSDLMIQLQATGITLLLVEHDMRLVMGICNRITVLDSGAKIAEGSPKQVQDDARVREAYIGREASA
jgi:branched-chain amino acid transport system ATP-binding protein